MLARDDQRRPQDRLDLLALIPLASAAELETARQALTEVTELGFHRGRDLAADLDRALAEAAR